MTPDELKNAQEVFIAKNFEDGLAVGAFKSYEQSPIFLAMKEALKFYGEGKHYKLTTAPEFRRGAFYDTVTIIEEIERGDLASALLKEIGEGE